MKYNKKLLSESTKTTERGEKTKGKSSHGEQPRSTMTKSAIKKRIAAAKEMRPKKGQLPDHTVYQDMGYLMAESLGLVSEATRKDTYGGTGPDRMSKTPFKRKESSESESPYKKKLARQTAQQTPAERQKDVEDVYTRSAQRRRAGTGERRYVAAMSKDPDTKKTIKPAKKGPKTIKGRRRAR